MAKEQFDEIKKEFGETSLMYLSDKPGFTGRVIPSGSFGLDKALGIGGYACGRIVEIYGPESSGKSTLCQHAVAEAQKLGGLCAYVDVENGLDCDYASNLGVDTENLLISQPDDGEQALNIVAKLIDTKKVSVIIVDSVAALVPKAELEGEIGDARMATQARLMSQGLRIINNKLKKSDTLVIFVNQLRMKLGVMFGNPETTPGGESLKFYASVRLDVRKKIIPAKEGEEPVANAITVKVVKNKTAPPFRKAEFDIVFGQGIDRNKELIDTGVSLGLIDKKGAWLVYEGNKIQGSGAFKQLLEDNPGLAEQLESQIKTKL